MAFRAFLFAVATLTSFLFGCKPESVREPDNGEVRKLSATTEMLRTLPFTRKVRSERKSKAEIQKYIERRMREEYTSQEIDEEKRALTLLGLIPANFDYERYIVELYREQIAGYYDPLEGALFLADWIGPQEVEAVVVHELTHALQDQHFGLKKFLHRTRQNDDETTAVNALIEGDAISVMLDLSLSPGGKSIVDLPDIGQTLRAQLAQAKKSSPGFEGTPRFLLETMLFPYVEGLLYVRYLRIQKGWPAVNAAFASPPRSTEQILHPERMVRPEGLPIPVPAEGWKPPAEFKVVSSNVLGEFGFRMLLLSAGEEPAARAAEGWGGDRYWLLSDLKSGKDALVLRSKWDSEDDALDFAATLEEGGILRGAQVVSRGKSVVVGIGLATSP